MKKEMKYEEILSQPFFLDNQNNNVKKLGLVGSYRIDESVSKTLDKFSDNLNFLT